MLVTDTWVREEDRIAFEKQCKLNKKRYDIFLAKENQEREIKLLKPKHEETIEIDSQTGRIIGRK